MLSMVIFRFMFDRPVTVQTVHAALKASLMLLRIGLSPAIRVRPSLALGIRSAAVTFKRKLSSQSLCSGIETD
jgi:hypothetical protein